MQCLWIQSGKKNTVCKILPINFMGFFYILLKFIQTLGDIFTISFVWLLFIHFILYFNH